FGCAGEGQSGTSGCVSTTLNAALTMLPSAALPLHWATEPARWHVTSVNVFDSSTAVASTSRATFSAGVYWTQWLPSSVPPLQSPATWPHPGDIHTRENPSARIRHLTV